MKKIDRKTAQNHRNNDFQVGFTSFSCPVIDSHFAPSHCPILPPPTFNTVIQWEKA